MITRNELMKNGINSKCIKKYIDGKLMHVRTSGSSGHYLDIYWDEADYIRSMMPLWFMRKKYYGISPNDTLMYFFTEFPGEESHRYIKNQIGIGKKMLVGKGLDFWYREFAARKPKWMILQPSTAVILCNYVKNNSLPVGDSVKYIEFTGETLADEIAVLVKEVFSCRTANQYGANEVNSIAYECPYGNMHVVASNVDVEIEQDTDNIIITSKQNHAMNIERYLIGDKGSLCRDKACKCGNKSPILMLYPTRKNEFVYLADGNKLDSYVFVRIFDGINVLTDGGVIQFFVEQYDFGRFLVRICRDKDVSQSAIVTAFMSIADDLGLEKSAFIFLFVPYTFEIDDNAKYIFFKNHMEENRSMIREGKGTLMDDIVGSIKLCLSAIATQKKTIKDINGENGSDPYQKEYEQYKKQIDEGELCKCEDSLYENQQMDMDYARLMLCVYQYMNEKEDLFLEKNNFSREEIQLGINEIINTYIKQMDFLFAL